MDHLQESDVTRDLLALRKGAGLRHPELVRRIGLTLRSLFSIDASDSHAAAAAKLRAGIEVMEKDMDGKLFQVLKCELNMMPECKFSKLGDRQSWFAAHSNIRPSTVRVWGGNAIKVVASLLTEKHNHPKPAPLGFTIEELARTSFYRGRRLETIHVRYQIKSLVDGLDHIIREHRIKRDASIKVDFRQCIGCRIEHAEYRSDGVIVCRIDLPERLQARTSHTLEYKIFPEESDLAADPFSLFWTSDFTPKVDINVQFDATELPNVAWEVAGLSGVTTPGDEKTCRQLQINRYGSTKASFNKTNLGRAYGLGWKWRDS